MTVNTVFEMTTVSYTSLFGGHQGHSYSIIKYLHSFIIKTIQTVDLQ